MFKTTIKLISKDNLLIKIDEIIIEDANNANCLGGITLRYVTLRFIFIY